MSRPGSHPDDYNSRSRSLSRREPSARRPGDYRRDFPSEDRRRRLDDTSGGSDLSDREKQNLRRHSSTTANQDPSKDLNKDPPTRSQTLDSSKIQISSIAEDISSSRVEMPSIPRQLPNSSLTAGPVTPKRPAETEPILDPRKRAALSGKNGRQKTPTASPTISSKPLAESKTSRQSSVDTTKARARHSLGRSQEDKATALKSLLINFLEQTATTTALQEKADELEAAANKAVVTNDKNIKFHQAYRTLIEQSEEQKVNTQKKAFAARHKYEASIRPRDELANKVANEIITLIEEPTDISERVTNLEQRWAKEQQELRAETVSPEAFKNLENIVKNMMKENAELRSELALRPTKAEMNALQLTTEESSDSMKLIEKQLGLKIASQQTLETISKSEFQTFTETTVEKLRRLDSQLEKVDEARRSDFQAIASDVQKHLVEYADWKSDLETSTADRDDEVIRLSNETNSIFAQFEEIQASIKELVTKPEKELELRNNLSEIQSRTDKVASQSSTWQTDGTSEQSNADISSLKKRLDEIEVELKNSKASLASTQTASKVSNSNIFSLKTRLDEIGIELQQHRTSASEQSNTTPSALKSRLDQMDDGWKKSQLQTSDQYALILSEWKKANSSVSSLRTRVEEIENQLQQPNTGVIEQLNVLNQRVAVVQNQLPQHVAGVSAQLDNWKTRLGEMEVQLQQQRARPFEQPNAEFASLKTRLDGIDVEVRKTHALGSASEHSIKVLSTRFNNLTTETLTRAMLQQVSIVYPYMATVQEEFTQVRRDREQLRILNQTVESTNSVGAKVAANFEKLTKERFESETKLADVIKQLNETKKDFENHLERHTKKISEIETTNTRSRKIIEQLTDSSETNQTELGFLRSRLDANDEEFLEHRAIEKQLRTKLEERVDAVIGRMEKVAENLAAKPKPELQKDSSRLSVDAESVVVNNEARGTSANRPTEMPGPNDEYLREWNPTKGPPERRSGDASAQAPRGPRNSNANSNQLLRLGHHELTAPPGAENKKKRPWNRDYDDRSDDDTYSPESKWSKSKASRRKRRGS